MKSDSLVLYVVALFSILYHDACFLLLFFSKGAVLTNLNLCRNHIGVEGAKAIGKALAVNAALTKLVLWDNSIGDEGEGVIRDAVSGRVGFELKMWV